MKSTTMLRFVFGILACFPLAMQAQTITNLNTSSQNCQCDTVTVSFSVTSPFNAGNQFRVELSDQNLATFSGNYIQIAPLLAFGIGGYNIQAIIPCTQSQGIYKLRVIGNNPIAISDTLSNIIIGKRPETQITTYGTYTFGQTQRFCNGDTAVLVGPAPPLGDTHQYQWFSNGAVIPGEINDTLIVTTSGAYAVKVTLGLCDKISNDTIINAYTPPANVFSQPNPSIKTVGTDSIQMCQGTVAVLEGPTGTSSMVNFGYQWLTGSIDPLLGLIYKPLLNDTLKTLNVTLPGKYYLTVIEKIGGCTDTSTMFTVFVDTVPTSSIAVVKWAWQTFATANLCPDDSVNISTTNILTGIDIGYQWQASFPIGSPFINVPGATDPSIVYLASMLKDTVAFRLVVTNLTCADTTNSIVVNYFDKPSFVFFPSDSIATCVNDSVLVQLIGNGLQYVWSDGFIGANRWMKTAGSFGVTATGVNQCTYTDSLKVGIYVVTANAGGDITIYKPEVNAQLNGSGGTSYFWYADKPSYFNNQLIANPITQPTSDTTLYFVEVTGPNGCKALDSVYVYRVDTLNDGKYANIQNVITPNGDGRNDFLNIPELLDGDDCELVIMNRWGSEVYRAMPYINNWNGTNTGGSELPDGTYYYIVKFEDTLRYKGPVTIIRNSK